MADVRISVNGRDSDVESLWDWLRSEPELRGHLRLGQVPGPAGAMGALAEIIVGVTSSGAAAGLTKAIQVWLVQRRADVILKISGPQGREIVLDAKRVKDAEHMMNNVLGWADNVPPALPVADGEDGE
jgi:Effector Associated Constant Component 1